MDSNLSAADVVALTGDNGMNAMNGLWSNPFIYLVWMYAMRWFNGNGWGGDGSTVAALNQAQLYDGLGRQDILNNQRSIQSEICNLNDTVLTSFGNVRYDNLLNMNNLQNATTAGFYSVNNGLTENRFATQQVGCQVQQAIADLKADNFKNTCDIVNATRTEGELTRGLINDQIIQGLRDKVTDKERELLEANFLLSQQNQNAVLIDALRPVSKPCYLTSSPYTSVNANGAVCSCAATY